jgi:SAM-dependent methyltransferase
MSVSTNYREITRSEALKFRATYSSAWLDPIIPERQYERVVKGELQAYREGKPVLSYDTFMKCLRTLPLNNPRILDVGASSGYYREVLNISNYICRYVGFDISQSYKRAAHHYFPGIQFDVGDCCHLPYANGDFDVVLHSACLMHELDYPEAISEAARVAKKYVIFHRTPIAEATKYFIKLGYDLEMVEIAFNEQELFGLFEDVGLKLKHSESMNSMRTYVLAKDA